MIKIAFRNIALHKKQSLLMGITLVLALTMISMLSVSLNGMKAQVYQNYIKIQSAHVIGVWKDVKEKSMMSPEKLLYLDSKLIESDSIYQSRKLTQSFKQYIERHRQEIEAVFYQVRQQVTLKVGDKEDSTTSLYSLSQAHAKWMIENESVLIEEGELLSEEGVCISREKATNNDLLLGDEIEIVFRDISGEEKHLKKMVTGIYANKAQYENYYLFMDEETAYDLVGYERDLFDMAKVYLKNPSKAQEFAQGLDQVLLDKSDLLRAEDYLQASVFYTRFYDILNLFYKIFFAFILVVIGVGLNATIHMNLLTRMMEFGTLRAIGYSKQRCYGIVFMEWFILAGISVGIALGITLLFVGLYGKSGLYVGSGAVTYVLGGESFCPKIKWEDILFTMMTMSLFTLTATIRPSGKLLKQTLTDLLAKRQKY